MNISPEARTPVSKSSFPQQSIEHCTLVRNFVDGDLLYGLEKRARGIYSPFIKDAHNVRYLTIDEINKHLYPQVYAVDAFSPTKLDDSQWNTPVKEFVSSWRNHESYPMRDISSVNQIPGSPESTKIQQSCFIAVDWIKQSGHTIHFCLDGFDTEAARDRQHENFFSYTSHELRYIATHWQELSQHVIFYNLGEVVNPPWHGQDTTEWLMSTINQRHSTHLSPAPLQQGRRAELVANYELFNSVELDNDPQNLTEPAILKRKLDLSHEDIESKKPQNHSKIQLPSLDMGSFGIFSQQNASAPAQKKPRQNRRPRALKYTDEDKNSSYSP